MRQGRDKQFTRFASGSKVAVFSVSQEEKFLVTATLLEALVLSKKWPLAYFQIRITSASIGTKLASNGAFLHILCNSASS